jgi:transcriptional regulator with XRE-family HTH domain
MALGENIIDLRKIRNLSREELAKIVGTSGAMIGKYERNEMVPSVEMAKKIADALDVTIDYLVGSSKTVIKDRQLLYRLEVLQQIGKQERERIYYVMDALIKDAQNTAYQQHLSVH